MKKFFALSLLASCCFAGTLKITGPEAVSFPDDSGEIKVMHRFYQDFADALKSSLTNSPKAEIRGDWKMQIILSHGMANGGLIPEFMAIDLTGGPYKPLEMMVPYPAVSKMKPAQLAGIVGKTLWKYMSTGKFENIPNLPAPQFLATVWPPARRFFILPTLFDKIFTQSNIDIKGGIPEMGRKSGLARKRLLLVAVFVFRQKF